LAQAVADEGDEVLFRRLIAVDPAQAPPNSPQIFLAVCGVIGLGKLLTEGKQDVWPLLRRYAADPRWRIREAVAMALQRFGEKDMDALIDQLKTWSGGNLLEKRAVAAALCEPKLLRQEKHAAAVLQLLDQITASIPSLENRRSDEFQVLKKGLGYCWSVAVVALPQAGQPLLEKWLTCPDKDVRWIMKENLKKNRLKRMDASWVTRWQATCK
jgi:HEAT repeat protein